MRAKELISTLSFQNASSFNSKILFSARATKGKAIILMLKLTFLRTLQKIRANLPQSVIFSEQISRFQAKILFP